MKKVLFFIVIFLMMLLYGYGLAFAEDEENATVSDGQSLYKKKTVYDFEDDLITGDLTKPDGEYIQSAAKVKHQNLIKYREDFKNKILGSVSDL
ncbi:MAG: adventurous gliding motility protein CglF [Deltaproteobacteria bacterium]|nr:adventurous gliding motility protein CglF [Deltaproteobacteria bacterium]